MLMSCTGSVPGRESNPGRLRQEYRAEVGAKEANITSFCGLETRCMLGVTNDGLQIQNNFGNNAKFRIGWLD